MTTLDIGAGAREVLARPARGRVVSVHRVAAYLRFPAGLLALTTGRAPRGPLHLRVAVLPAPAPGDRVHTDGAVLAGTGWAVDLAAPTWVGALPAAERLGSGSPGDPVRDLAALAAVVGGRGPGLTPEGDDLLAGALLAVRAARGGAGLAAVAASVSTTEVAGAFLRWAARGQCIEPAHGWLAATAAGDTARTAHARARLLGVGASSGAALLRGMQLGLTGLPRLHAGGT